MVKCRLDDVAAAVASAPRRSIIERLADAPASMTDLAGHLQVTLPAVDKHLRVLLGAGVVTKDKQGRTTVVRLVPGSLDDLGTWAMSTRLMWSNALDRLETSVAGEPVREEDP
jgi:DNA-binding transcriptional ArsR family regulator